jgi:hypothetical protein
MNFLVASIVGALFIVISPFLRGTKDKFPDVCVAGGLVYFALMLIVPGHLSAIWHPHTMDLALYRADLALGLDSLALARFVTQRPWLWSLLVRSYQVLPIVVALAYAIERSRTLLWVCIIAPILAFVGYNLVPPSGQLMRSADSRRR